MFIGPHAAGFAARSYAPELSATIARDAAGSITLWALVILLIVVLLNLVHLANVFSPEPPDGSTIAWVALAAWLFVPWDAWIDRHRQPRP